MSLFGQWFDQLDSEEEVKEDIRPLWTVAGKNDEQLHKWCWKTTQAIKKANDSRHQMLMANLALYKGVTLGARDRRAHDFRSNADGLPTTRMPRLQTNHLFDITEQIVSRTTALKPAVEVLPTNDEHEDKIAAEVVDKLIRHLWYINDVDDLRRQAVRHKIIFGESYLFIGWDSGKGDDHPDFEPGLALVDETLSEVQDDDGKSIKIQKAPKIGDVCYEIELPWRVLADPKRCWDKVDYIIRVLIKHKDDVKRDYPKSAKSIDKAQPVKIFDGEMVGEKRLKDEILVYELFHRVTDKMPKGKRVLFTSDEILEKEDLPYSHGELPCERLTDIDMPDVLHGVSIYDIIKPLQLAHNSLSSSIIKNQYLASAPKWVMPKGACKIENLGNDITIVQYKGGVPPTLVQSNPTPQEVFLFRNTLKEELEQISGVFGTSRGNPPSGITASVALQFLNEQEQQRASSAIAKSNKWVQSVARKTVAVAGDYYRPDDGRMIRILGKDNRYDVRQFDAANLSKNYDIRIQNSSALPQSKAARIQSILDITERMPELLTNEQVLDLLDFGQSDKLTDIVTEAIRSAESENEDLLSGTGAMEPKEWEDHILHWRAHVQATQSREFKENVPEELQMQLLEHIKMTEFLMSEKAQENPLFQAKLAQLDLYPIAYKQGIQPSSREDQLIRAQGAANRGQPESAVVPATEPDQFPGERRRAPQGE